MYGWATAEAVALLNCRYYFEMIKYKKNIEHFMETENGKKHT